MRGVNEIGVGSLAVTLFATSMGRKLYGKLGFRDLGVVGIQVEGESGPVCLGAMAYVPTCDEPFS